MVFNINTLIGAQLNRFRELVLGEPTQSQRATCVSLVEDVMPTALARVYAQHILPSGYKVSHSYKILMVMYIVLDDIQFL